MESNELSGIVINKAFKVHQVLGPGLLESAYEKCLMYELSKAGLEVSRQQEIPLIYERIKIDCSYRADLIVNNEVLIELKSVPFIIDIHVAQTLTYLRLSGIKLGLIINFNTINLKQGIKRVIR
ncbi:MAG: GxxExxY protein [Sphingobacteriales bacterium]|jgi:GxxExxY protein|nr:GxxExxY protein [Sphingobacteriales bacterium]